MDVDKLLKELGQQHLVGKVNDSKIKEHLLFIKELNLNEAQNKIEDVKTSEVLNLDQRSKNKKIEEIGVEAYKNAEVAVVMVAGGQGTRLGFNGPKGCYKTSVVKQKSLYQLHSEKVLATSLKYGNRVPFLIMTSPATDKKTRDFFEENNFFGLSKEQVHFFVQATVPSTDLDGKLLLSGDDSLVQNPDGHGGCFTALISSGLLEQLTKTNIKHLAYIQVDNYLAPIFDPFLIGLAVEKNADVITKVVEKTKPEEKVGLLVNVNGKDSIQEYINLSEETLKEKEGNKLKYCWGNTAMHYWSIDFFNREKSNKLTVHKSKKPLKTKNGEVQGYKYERFIFDLLPLAKVSLGLEIDRNSEFAPLKNKEGSDSIETVHEISSSLYRSWLKECNIELALEKKIEISPLLALNEPELKLALDIDKSLVAKLKSEQVKIYLE